MDSWISRRKNLYEQLTRQVKKLVGKESPGMAAYRRAFEREFPKTYEIVDHRELIRVAAQKKVVLLADFHCLKNSQKNQLKLLVELSRKRRGRLSLACEFFEAQHQAFINDYCLGLLSEDDFLEKIRWKKRWGFPWENYRPLVQFAIDHGLSILALNKYYSERSPKTLKLRDQFSARLIADHLLQKPNSLVLVIYGEQHLAWAHLPKQILRAEPSLRKENLLRVFQNHEKLFFDLIDRRGGHRVDVIKLGPECYCIQSLPPWVKWQNYLIYLEKESGGFPLDSPIGAEEDHLDDVARFLRILSHDFNLEIAQDDFEVYPVRVLARILDRSKALNKMTKNWALSHAHLQLSFYIPELGIAFLYQPTVNDFARLAASIFVCQTGQLRQSLSQGGEDFQKLVWYEGLVHFLIKMLNPKKKAKKVSEIYPQKLPSRNPHLELDSLKLALWQRAREIFVDQKEQFQLKAPKVKVREDFLRAALILGGPLGERIFTLHRQGVLSTYHMQKMLTLSFESPDFDQAYERWIKELDKHSIEEVRPFF